ncbi:hypothetical protein NPIL_250701 [Nephila pilipes]|uniref:RNase H type-1 domain-containing protein n=1 Tax=Nephila pilipes TaxID=299642 RepID=A0A8X6TT43_NEPPI|nr:hypothetical protein NPIL_250701 [Nephila pilipes]
MAVTYTDGSSDKYLNRRGARVFFAHPDGSIHKHRINTGMTASNFTSELLAIKEALTIYLTDLRMLGYTEDLAIFPDSNSALQDDVWQAISLECFRKLVETMPRLVQSLPED